MTTYETILVDKDERVGTITLNRPNALNALNSQLMVELGQALKAFDADPAIGCMILTGSEGPCGVGGKDDPEYTVIIMPMKIVEDASYNEEEV